MGKLPFFLPLLCAAQTAQYPGAVVTDNQLMVAKNNLTTALLSPVAVGDTTVTVKSTTGFAANMLITIDKEVMKICAVVGSNGLNVGYSSCPNSDGRGFDGTTAASHLSGAAVLANINAWYHNAVTAEIKAIESALGPKPVTFNVNSYGADPSGTNDSTTAINNAASAANTAGGGTVLLPTGTYKVTNAINLTGNKVILDGQGSIILVPANFTLSALGVIVLNYAKDPGCTPGIGSPSATGLCPGSPTVKNVTIRFQNADTVNYSSLIQFPPGITCGDQYGCNWATIDNVRITQAMTGIKIKPQAGTATNQGAGVRMTNIQISAFDYGLYLNGSDSEMIVDGYYYYPFEMTNNHGQIWPIHGTGIWAAALYDLNITNYTASNFFKTISANFDGSVRQYCPSITVAGLVVDTFGGIDVNCGDIHISAGVWKVQDSSAKAVNFANIAASGALTISSSLFSHAPYSGTAQTYKIINSGGTVTLSDNIISLQGSASLASSSFFYNGNGGTAKLTGNRISPVADGFDFSGTSFIYNQAGGALSLTGNTLAPRGTSANGGIFFEANSDHVNNAVAGNAFGGWPVTYPSSKLLGTYQAIGCHVFSGSGTPNGNVAGNPCDTYLNTAGGAAATFYVKETGAGTTSGWVAK
jgi:hypothetical protein